MENLGAFNLLGKRLYPFEIRYVWKEFNGDDLFIHIVAPLKKSDDVLNAYSDQSWNTRQIRSDD